MTDYEKGVKDCFIATKTWVAVRLSSLRFIAFLIFFFICLLGYLTYYYNSEAYVAFSVLESSNNEMQDSCRDRQGFEMHCSFLSLH